MTIIAWLTNFLGFWLLAIAMPRNRKLLMSKRTLLPADNILRFVGFMIIFLSLLLSCQEYDIAEGIVIWCYRLTLCSLLIALTISYRQKQKSAR